MCCRLVDELGDKEDCGDDAGDEANCSDDDVEVGDAHGVDTEDDEE